MDGEDPAELFAYHREAFGGMNQTFGAADDVADAKFMMSVNVYELTGIRYVRAEEKS